VSMKVLVVQAGICVADVYRLMEASETRNQSSSWHIAVALL